MGVIERNGVEGTGGIIVQSRGELERVSIIVKEASLGVKGVKKCKGWEGGGEGTERGGGELGGVKPGIECKLF